MDSKDTKDLLKPISKSSPCGENIHYSSEFDAMKEARRSEDENISYGVWQSHLKKTNWDALEELCTTALTTKSKDLQIIGWLCECYIHKNKFAGLLQGIELIEQMLTNFWDCLHPVDDRTYIFDWMDRAFVDQIIFIPLTPSGQTLDLATWNLAIYNDQLKRRHIKVDTKILELSRYRQFLNFCPKKHVEEIKDDIKNTKNQISKIDKFLNKKLGNHFGHFLFNTLEELNKVENIFINEYKPIEDEIKKKEPVLQRPTPKVVDISGEDNPYEAIAKLNEKIKLSDPKSPVPFMIDIALSWKDKTFSEILEEMKEGKNPNYEFLRLIK